MGFCAHESRAQEDSFVSEIRAGVLKHDIGGDLGHRHERGYDINAEMLFTAPENAVFDFLFSPRPHLGTSINTRGGSHQFYFGLTWHFDFFEYTFLELSFGGSANTGKRKTPTRRKQALGSNIMFRESVSLGLNLGDRHTLSVILDHTSNASLASRNPGLTGLGLRYGYKL